MPRDFERGLGAAPSPPDERDYILSIPNQLTLPTRYTLSYLGPVLDQGKTGTCVAHAAAGVRMWQEYRDKTSINPYVTQPAVFQLYDWCKAADQMPDPKREFGTSIRTVLNVLRKQGTPLGNGKTNGGRIAAYYGVPVDITTMKNALMQHGPLLVGTAWDQNWFSVPTNLILKAPSGKQAGGHAYFIWGWDDLINGGSWIIRNSWGRGRGGWTATGNAYMKYSYFTYYDHREAWWVQDILGDPIT